MTYQDIIDRCAEFAVEYLQQSITIRNGYTIEEYIKLSMQELMDKVIYD